MSERSDHDLLISMDTKLDIALGSLADHEKRIRSIERRIWTLSTAAGLAGSTLAFVLDHITLKGML